MSDPALEVAIGIADRLCAEAIWSGDRATWLGDFRETVNDETEVVHRSLEGDVYGGTAGVGLFLCRLWSHVPGERLQRTARGALAHAVEWCRTTRPSASLYSGAGGVACVVNEAASTFSDDALASEARALALDALDRPIQGNDLISGRAGAIVSFLCLGRTLGLAEAISTAVEMGDTLISTARRSPVNGAHWDAEGEHGEPPLCGLAHGVSGMAYALGLLSAEVGDPTFAEVAAEAAIYERGCYQRDQGNWPDLRELSRSKFAKGETPPFPVFWCHGAVGIGLARLWQYEATGQTVYGAEAEAAIQAALKEMATISEAGPITDGSICHGAAGIAELLLEGARVFDQPALRALGRDCALLVADSAVGGEWPSGIFGGGENPSLMLGTAGIGLVLLRVAEPATAAVGLLYSPGVETARLIVQLKAGIGVDQASQRIAELSGLIDGCQVERVSRRGRILLRVPQGIDVGTALEALNEHADVEYAEADVVDSAQLEG